MACVVSDAAVVVFACPVVTVVDEDAALPTRGLAAASLAARNRVEISMIYRLLAHKLDV